MVAYWTVTTCPSRAGRQRHGEEGLRVLRAIDRDHGIGHREANRGFTSSIAPIAWVRPIVCAEGTGQVEAEGQAPGGVELPSTVTGTSIVVWPGSKRDRTRVRQVDGPGLGRDIGGRVVDRGRHGAGIGKGNRERRLDGPEVGLNTSSSPTSTCGSGSASSSVAVA